MSRIYFDFPKNKMLNKTKNKNKNILNKWVNE